MENLSEGVELLWRKYEEEVRKIEATEPPGPPMMGGNWGGQDILGQKFQKVENDENRFFAITSSKLFKN